MVERYVFVKLTDEWGPRREEVAAYSKQVLAGLDRVRGLRIGVPADDRSAGAWDLSLVLAFDSADDIPPYVADPEHRRYVDEYLRPKMDAIKAWNFVLT